MRDFMVLAVVSCFVAAFPARSETSFSKESLTPEFASTIFKLSDPKTGIPPSHIGHPGFERLTFLYDVSVNAMMLKMAGRQAEAERIMDYFVKRLAIPQEQVQVNVDSNNVLGILKSMTSDAQVLGLVNAFDSHAPQRVGRGHLEFLTTPGPVSFMIMAFLQVNKEKYLPQAIQLGKAALLMQDETGGIVDGDRSKHVVNTEPHLDAANAFLQLYRVTGDQTWKMAGEKAVAWFRKNVFHPESAQIDQGTSFGTSNTIFATDVYSWTMAGMVGDMLSSKEIEGLTDTMLKKSLSQVTMELPGGITQTMIMADFTDSRDEEGIRKRGGFHPMGSPEWSGGVILALQKNAVRLWNKDYFEKARDYKAMAEYLMSEVLKSSYKVNGIMMFPYATGQGIEVGHGWKTPYFYVKDPAHPIAGGSLVGGWPLMPMNGFNPFMLEDNYFFTYKAIDIEKSHYARAVDYIGDIVAKHQFTEAVVTTLIDGRTQIVEPNNFNASAWKAFEEGKYEEAISWARKVIEDFQWVELAKREQKLKMERVGGLIDYPWGKIYENNENPVHFEIMKYPLLNEVATAMWLLANSYLELKRIQEAKYWIKRIIDDVPLHQIAHLAVNHGTGKNVLIDGYWNALVSWVDNPSQSRRDQAIFYLIREMGLEISAPVVISYETMQLTKLSRN